MFAIMAMGICLNNFYQDFLGAIELFMQHTALLFRATLFFGSLIGLLLIAYALYCLCLLLYAILTCQL